MNVSFLVAGQMMEVEDAFMGEGIPHQYVVHVRHNQNLIFSAPAGFHREVLEAAIKRLHENGELNGAAVELDPDEYIEV